MNSKLWFSTLFLIVSLLVACAPISDRNKSHQANVAVETVIIYEREGGIAGISQEWVIHLDGTIDAPGDQKLTVPPEDVQEIVEAGAESDISSLTSESSTPDACCDQFTYTITMVSGDKEWQLMTTDTAEQPEEVSELFIMIEALIAAAEPAPQE